MPKCFTLIFLLLLQIRLSAQALSDKMDFAGVKLVIEQEVSSEIEKNAYTYLQNEKFLKILIDRTDTYFPIISKILKEEKVPDDFKYLAVMESKLISDAISSSGAEGFWQMKKEAAIQFGIEAGLEVDERRHIILSTQAAVRYLKKSNETFNNWIYALLSYNLGLQGAISAADYKFYSTNKMIINSKTHWYIIKAISCKIALQRRIGTNVNPRVILFEYRAVKGQTLQEISLYNQVAADSVFAYNKWLKTVKIPGGKLYTVFIPLVSSPGENNPVPRELYANNPNPVLMTKNGLSAIQAKIGDTYEKLAIDGKIPLEKLKEFNEIGPMSPLYHGQICYLEKKHKKSHAYLPRFHIVKHGETLWRISQNFGVESSMIRKFNKLKEATDLSLAEEPRKGQKLWLKEPRPDSVGIEMLVNIRENRFDEISPENEIDTLARAENEQKPKTDNKEPHAGLNKERVYVYSLDPETDSLPSPDSAVIATTTAKKDKVYIYSLDSKTDSFPSLDSAINFFPLANKTEEKEKTGLTIEDSEKNKKEKELPVKTTATHPEKEKTEKKKPAIAAANTKTPGKPVPGKEKKSPEKPVPDGKKYHEWEKGESLYDIASKYKCTIKQILVWNNLSANAKEVGMKLLIKDPKESLEPKPVYHKVLKGETLWRISVIYKSSLNQLITWNNLSNHNLSIGQMLRVSGGQEHDITTINMGAAEEEETGKKEDAGFYIVVPGDNLFRISQKYDVAVDELMSINQLPNHHVFVGQKVRIKTTAGNRQPVVSSQKMPASPAPKGEQPTQQQGGTDQTFHVVEVGETLFGISKKYKVPIEKIRQWNNISGNNITVGEQLIVSEIPAVSGKKPAAGSKQAATGSQPRSKVGADLAKIENVSRQTDNASKLKPTEHTVAQGENLLIIAKKYSVTPAELKMWNKLKTMTVAKGQALIVSDPTAEPGKHKVKPGEVLPVIAKKYNVAPEQLKTWNNLKTSAVKPGQALWVINPEENKKVTPEPPVTTYKESVTLSENAGTDYSEAEKYTPDPNVKMLLHTVREGQTIFQLANKYNATVSDIMKINRLTDYKLEAGQRITIPFLDPAKYELINHTVGQGETLYSIARQYNCKVSEILDWNEKQEMNIQIGEVLKMRRGK